MRDPYWHVRPRTEQDADVFRRAVFAAMRQGISPEERRHAVVVQPEMTAHPGPRPEVPLILNGVAVTARKPDPAAWAWLLAAITHADSEAELAMRSMDLLAYALDSDDMRRWQATGVHSGAEIKTAAGVVIRALRQDGEPEVRELHDAAGRTVQHEVQCAGGQVFQFETGAEARKAAARIHGAVYRTRALVVGVQSYMHSVAPILPPPEDPPVDRGKDEPGDAPKRSAAPIIGLLVALFMAAGVGTIPGVNALPIPDWAKGVLWILLLVVLCAGTMRGIYLVLRWADQKPQVIEPPRSTEPSPAPVEPEREPAFVLDSGTFTPVSDCPACNERAVHALDVAHTGDGIGRVCECGHRWSQTGL